MRNDPENSCLKCEGSGIQIFKQGNVILVERCWDCNLIKAYSQVTQSVSVLAAMFAWRKAEQDLKKRIIEKIKNWEAADPADHTWLIQEIEEMP